MFKNPILIAALNLVVSTIIIAQSSYPVDLKVVAKIREEGFQRSEIINTLSYMTDVLGARLTNSDAMYEAQEWAIKEMKKMGLKNTCLLYTSPSPRDS